MLVTNKESSQSVGQKRKSSSTLTRGLEILRCFKPEDQSLGNGQIAERTGLSKPTVSRLSHSLAESGYLRRSEIRGKYSLGPALIEVGYSLLAQMNIRRIARPLMQVLAEHTQGAVTLGVRNGLSMIYVDTYRSVSNFSIQLEVDSKIPIGLTASGRAHLVALPENERAVLMGLIQQDDEINWPLIRAGMEQAMKEYRDKGYCLSQGDWRKEINSIAVPLVLEGNSAEIIVFSCSGPVFQLDRQILEDEIGPRLLNLVSNVQSALKIERN